MLNIFQQLQAHAQQCPYSVALWHNSGQDQSTSTTFSELAMMARHFAAAFQKKAPDAVILPMYLSKSAECVAAMIGAIGAGKTFACLNKKLRPPQINAILHDSSATLGLIDTYGTMTLRSEFKIDSKIAQTNWWLLHDQNTPAPHKKAISDMRNASRVEDWPFNNEIEDSVAIPKLNNDPQRTGCCLFTSGSTGTPKGVLITEFDLRKRASAEINWFGLSKDDVLLSLLPFSFDVGLNQLLSALTVGCTLVLSDSWLPADILKAVTEFKVTGISGVPAIWVDMLNASMYFDTTNEHASLRYITISGGDLNQHYLEQLPKLAPNVDIFKTYGQTEAFRATSLHPKDFHTKPTSVGQPFEGVNVYIVREDGTKCNANEVGEVVHTGLGVMLGYLSDDHSQNKLRPNPFIGEHDNSHLAIFTGDMGYFDEDGYLFLQGRSDTMLKVAGNRIYLKEIINQILTIESVQETEVIGIKTNTGDTDLFAFVVLAADANVTSIQIRRQLASLLPSYMVPRQVIIMAFIPRTASGKPDYPVLIEHAKNILKS